MKLEDIAFSVSGKKCGPPLIFLHALGADQRMWHECVELLKEEFTIVLIDLRGAGKSQIPPRRWSLDDHASDVETVRASLGLQNVVVVGCAVGALIAAIYAINYPQQIDGLVLSEPTVKVSDDAHDVVRARASAVRSQGMQALVPAAIDMAFESLPRDHRYANYTEIFLSQPPEGYAQLAESIVGCDLSQHLPGLSMPALVVVGEHDRLFPPEMAQRVNQLLPNSKLVVMKHCAHFPPVQRPGEFARHVEAFLSSDRLAHFLKKVRDA